MHKAKVGKHEPILILVSSYWGARQNEFLPSLLHFYYMDIIWIGIIFRKDFKLCVTLSEHGQICLKENKYLLRK